MDRHAWDERHGSRHRTEPEEPNRFLVATLRRATPGTALDVACGRGRNAVWLAEQGWAVTGIDWSPVALRLAAQRAAEHGVALRLVDADLLEWEPEDRYDLVCLLYLQVPAPERHAIWRKAASAVAPGGRVLIIGHDARNLEEGYGGPSSATVLYTAAEAAGVVGEHLVVARAETLVRPVEVEDGVRHAIDNLVLAVRAEPGRRGPGGAVAG